MDDLLKLAERCEKATRPHRELDAEIALTQGWSELPGDNWCGPHGQICVPAYSDSIDAALTLVPEGAFWTIGSEPWAKPWARCYHVDRIMDQPEGYGDAVEAATPALALCAAALRALAGEKR